MNSSPGEAVNVQNSIDNEQLAARCSSKQNKKKIYSTAKGSNNKAQSKKPLNSYSQLSEIVLYYVCIYTGVNSVRYL